MFIRTKNTNREIEGHQVAAWHYLEPFALAALKQHKQEEKFEGKSYAFHKAMQVHLIHIYFMLMYVDYKERFLTYDQLMEKYKFPCIKKYFFCWNIDFDKLLSIYGILPWYNTNITGIEGEYEVECSLIVQKQDNYCLGTDLLQYNLAEFLDTCIDCTNHQGQSRIEYYDTLDAGGEPLLVDDCKNYLSLDAGECKADNEPYTITDNGIEHV